MKPWCVPAAASDGFAVVCAEEGLASQRLPLSIKPPHSTRAWASLIHPDTRDIRIMQQPQSNNI